MLKPPQLTPTRREVCASWAATDTNDLEVRAPKRLILVRHGQSEGNVDSRIYASTADNILHLTETGWQQALCAGTALKDIIGDDHVKFAVSPYVRTRETFNAIAKPWGGSSCVRWSEDPRLREQDFGNFQDVREVKKAKTERSDFGPFYYRMPSGESPADVYDRVSSFFETMHRSWNSTPSHVLENLNYILIIHGVTISCFLMRLFKYSVDEFHNYDNFGNAEFCVLERTGTKKYHPEDLYCVRQEFRDGIWVSERGPRRVRNDAGRFNRAINDEPPSVLAAHQQDTVISGASASHANTCAIEFDPDIALGFRCADSSRVESVAENSQADILGVMPNWHVLEVDSKPIGQSVREAIRSAKTKGKAYKILFLNEVEAKL